MEVPLRNKRQIIRKRTVTLSSGGLDAATRETIEELEHKTSDIDLKVDGSTWSAAQSTDIQIHSVDPTTSLGRANST